MKTNTRNTFQKWLLSAALFASVFSTYPQIGVGITTPEGALDIVSTNSAFILSRVANTAAVTNPINGMIIYDQSEKCFKGYQDGRWTACGFQYIENNTGNNTIVIDVTSLTGNIWMDRNLGASQVATSSSDILSYGDLYQWGRAADGHQLSSSGITSAIAISSNPGHDNFISQDTSPYDWLVPKNDNLWQGVNGINNPCPSGYRIPTSPEWDNERLKFATNDRSGAYESDLKLSAAGLRSFISGTYDNTFSSGNYWSSTAVSDGVIILQLQSNAILYQILPRAFGFSVRCIKN